MASKMDKPISHVYIYINGQITITVVRSYSRMIRGARLESPLQDREPDWDPELGIELAG